MWFFLSFITVLRIQSLVKEESKQRTPKWKKIEILSHPTIEWPGTCTFKPIKLKIKQRGELTISIFKFKLQTLYFNRRKFNSKLKFKNFCLKLQFNLKNVIKSTGGHCHLRSYVFFASHICQQRCQEA